MDPAGCVRLIPGTAGPCRQEKVVHWPRVPREGAHGLRPATLRQGFSFLTREMPAKLHQRYSHRRREALAGYGPRRGYAARGSGVGSARLPGFWGRCGFASLPPHFPRAKPPRAFLYGLFPCRKMLVSLIFHSLVRKKEKLSREGSAGWDF